MSINNRVVEPDDSEDLIEFYEEQLAGERFQRGQRKESLQKYRKKNPGFKPVK